MARNERRSGALAIVALLVIVVIAGALTATLGVFNVAADSSDTKLVSNLLQYVRERSIDVRMGDIKVPPLEDADMIVDGAADYDAMCTLCHLGPGVEESEMRPGLNPKPPALASGPVGDPAEQFWIIKHGIKMTGMPAWGVTHSDREIWNIVAFLQKLPGLEPAQYKALIAKSAGHHDHHAPEGEEHMHHDDH